MKITCCTIFRDEEKHLPRWVECAKKLGDEVIAVDTGSVDGSVSVLKGAGIEPFFYKWNDDFAGAKNFAIEQATRDWIAFLDADEYFLPKDIDRLKRFIEEVDRDKNILAIENVMINIDEDEGDSFISKISQMRLFRNIKELRYKGKIHEKLYLKGNKPIQYINSEIEIYHTGYSRKLMEKKGRRNLELMQKEIGKKGKLTTEEACYMANSYMQLNAPKEAAKYAKLALKGKDKELKLMAIKMCRVLIIAEDDANKKLELIEKGIKRFDAHPDLLFEKGKILYIQERYSETEEAFKQALQKLNDKTYMSKYEANFYNVLHLVYEVLADIAYRKGDGINAKKYIVEALKRAKNEQRILKSFANYFKDDVLVMDKCLKEIYGEDYDV